MVADRSGRGPGLEDKVGSDEEGRLRSTGELAGVPVDAERAGAMAAFLAEVREVADELLALDLEGVEPDVGFDPRWTEGAG